MEDGTARELPIASWPTGPVLLLPDAPAPSLLPCVTLEFGGEWGVGV